MITLCKLQVAIHMNAALKWIEVVGYEGNHKWEVLYITIAYLASATLQIVRYLEKQQEILNAVCNG
jgi:hypothetical protein